MNTKHIAIALGATALLANAALADKAHTSTKPFTGLSAGVGVGLNINHFHSAYTSSATDTVDGNSPFLAFQHDYNEHAYRDQFAGRLHAGYTMALNKRLRLGLEAGINFSSASMKTVHDQKKEGTFGNVTVQGDFENTKTVKLSSTEFTIDAKPGFMVNQHSVIYGILGAAFNHIKTDSATSLTTNTDPGGIVSVNNSKKQSVAGLRLGLGMSTLLSDNLSLDLSYTYTNYGKSNLAQNTAESPDGNTGEAQVVVDDGPHSDRISRHTVLAGLSYHFG